MQIQFACISIQRDFADHRHLVRANDLQHAAFAVIIGLNDVKIRAVGLDHIGLINAFFLNRGSRERAAGIITGIGRRCLGRSARITTTVTSRRIRISALHFGAAGNADQIVLRIDL